MLLDAREIEIMSHAIQPGLRREHSPREPFERIVDDFPVGVLDGRAVVDLGPGQWDFGEVARSRGATRVVGIDSDPAVLELGRYKGFESVEADLRRLPDDFAGTFDVVFCRGSINAFWFASDDEQARLNERIAAMVRPGGWLWIAPWNVAPEGRPDLDGRLALQADTYRRLGFDVRELDDASAERYGITDQRTANRALFVGRPA